MSSIDREPDELLVSFFEREFAPARESLRDHDIELIDPGPDPDCPSYYSQREKTILEPTDFELDLDDVEKLMLFLEQLWLGPEKPILADLFRKILALAPRYREEPDSDEISPYIYAMF
jgi:hypothetical protein